VGTLRDPPKPPEDGLPKPPPRPTLERDAPKLGRPELGRATLERPELPPRDGLAPGRRTPLVRLGPVLGRLEDGVGDGRRTLPVRVGLVPVRPTVAARLAGGRAGVRALVGVRVTVGARVIVGVRPTVPVRDGVPPARPTVLVRP
jgi:hypothetical protein